jgi:hypothetical protein
VKLALVLCLAAASLSVVPTQPGRAEGACSETPRATRPAPGLSTLSTTWWYRNYVWMGVAGAFRGQGFVADPKGQKIGWYRQRRGRLHVYATRLDGPPASFAADVIQAYGTIGFQPSGLTFGAPGCWAVTAVVGNQASRFVVRVAPPG